MTENWSKWERANVDYWDGMYLKNKVDVSLVRCPVCGEKPTHERNKWIGNDNRTEFICSNSHDWHLLTAFK